MKPNPMAPEISESGQVSAILGNNTW